MATGYGATSSKYYAPSGGVLAAQAFEEELIRREEQRRQDMLDQLMRQRQDAEIRQRDEQLSIQRQQNEEAARQREQAQADLENERRFRRATTIANAALPGDRVDADTEALLTEQGYGSQVQRGQPTQGAHRGVDAFGVDQYDVVPGILEMRGGSQYLNARAADEARAAQAREQAQAVAARAEADRNAANERAAADRETRAMIAAMAQSGRAETTGLRNDLLRGQIQAQEDKRTQAAETTERARASARQVSGDTLDLLRQLAEFDDAKGTATLKSGAQSLYGARIPFLGYIPGSDTAEASAALKRLKGRVLVDLMNEMKSQSRTGATGFGSLTAPELQMLEQTASTLDSSLISDQAAADELRRIYDIAKKAYDGAAPPNAQRRGRYNPATGKVEY